MLFYVTTPPGQRHALCQAEIDRISAEETVFPAMRAVSMKSILRFLESEDGPTAVEYAVMLSLIVIVCMTAISSIGSNAKVAFSRIANSISH